MGAEGGMNGGTRSVWLRASIATLATGLVAGILVGSYGSLRWPMAWALLAWYALYSLAGFARLPRELIDERSRIRGPRLRW
jgi:hypothetical protein